ncbi:MAG: hypothetical protein J5I81_07150, partial [Nitrococcus mobilis]|nr:hypothetical protein [Nitrococcus mobilis]
PGGGGDVQSVEVDSLSLVRPRSVGVEQLGLWALRQAGLEEQLQALGLTGPQRAAAVGLIIGRMAAPGSERATHQWLARRSGLGELLEVDFEAMSPMQLYRTSDILLRHRAALEGHLFITVLAYQFVQLIRHRLAAHGIHERWSTLRDTLAGQCRVTATFNRGDGRTLYVRKTTRPEPDQARIYQALGADPARGGVQKTIV